MRQLPILFNIKDPCGQFIVGLANEVRDPFVNINLSLEILKSAIKDDGQKVYLDIIMRNATRINNTIDELHAYQQANDAQVEKYSVHRLIDEVIAMEEERIKLKSVIVKKEYATQDCQLVLNRQKIKTVITNIIVNAIDAMGPESGILNVVTKLVDGKYTLQIADNGCGISKANLEHLFKDNFTTKPESLGLGLTTINHFIQSNNIGTNVESVEGMGTRFILSFNETHGFKPLQ